jgi:hypothetical protein
MSGSTTDIINSAPEAIDAYRIAIENLAKLKADTLFKNSGSSHAAIVLGNIFKSSNDSVKMIAKDFNGEVSGNPYYIEALTGFLKSNKSITIIFEGSPNPDSKALSLLNQYRLSKPAHISLRVINKPLQVSPPNFTIGDNSMFRYETNKEVYTALCSFNDKDFVAKLDGIFNSLLEFTANYSIN